MTKILFPLINFLVLFAIAQTVVAINAPTYSYEIIKDRTSFGKRWVDVLLNREVTEDELRAIAKKIEDSGYHSKWEMKFSIDDAVFAGNKVSCCISWATVRYTPTLEVNITAFYEIFLNKAISEGY